MRLTREDFINQYPPLTLMNGKELESLKMPSKKHLYVHIPFCVKRCQFCYYKTYETLSMQLPDTYIEALIQEIQMIDASHTVLNSMYWGGGTPTLMSEKQIVMLMEAIKEKFCFADNAEFCCEMRPGPELTKEKLQLLKDYGLQRASLGCQSLNDVVLQKNGRNHSKRAFLRAYELVKEMHYRCINVDMMTGMLGDNLVLFMDSMRQLAQLHPENITIYKMQLYYNSQLYRRLRKEQLSLLTDQEEYHLAETAYQYLLESGYVLADNFSFKTKEEYEHIHRTRTWLGEDMIGVGLSAHSCVGRVIYQNESDIERYYGKIAAQKLPVYRAYRFSIYEQMIRHFIFGVKRCHYQFDSFYEAFGCDVRDIFHKQLNFLVENNFVNVENDIMVTTLTGALYADDIVRSIFPNGQDKALMGHQKRG